MTNPTPEQQATIERVERVARYRGSIKLSRVDIALDDLVTILDLAKRAVREPSDSDVERVAKDLEEAWLARGYGEGDQWRYLARAAIKAWQECGE